MWAEDEVVRARFARWVRRRLRACGLTEADVGRVIGRRPGWLGRFVARSYARNELTSVEANRIVEALDGNPDLVLPRMAMTSVGESRSKES